MQVYVFMRRRPCDNQPWPCTYTDHDLALKAEHRVSAVARVTFKDDGGRGWQIANASQSDAVGKS